MNSGNWKPGMANWKLETEIGLRGEKRNQTNPMQLRDVISIEYKEKAGGKPNGVIHHYISMLRGFPASF
jgi:hypothetical protein